MEFRIVKRVRIVAIISAAFIGVLGIIFVGGAIVPPLDGGSLGMLTIGMVLLAMATLFLLETLRSRLIIDRDVISLQHAFYTRTLHAEDIAGYRYFAGNRIRVVPKSSKHKKIDISVYMDGRKDLLGWLQRFPDLERADYQQASNDIFTNEEFGTTPTERLERLRKARQAAQAGNVIAILSTLWVWLWPKPYATAMVSAFMIPWVGFWLAWRYKGLLTAVASRVKSPHPSIIGMLFFPVMGLLLRIIFDYRPYQPSSTWVPLLVVAIPVIAIGLLTAIKAFAVTTKKWAHRIVLSICLFLYSFTLVAYTNCYYDSSTPQVFSVRINGKHTEKNKVTTYHITLEKWGHYTEEKDEEIKQDLYNKLSEGQYVHIFLLPGKWNIPWYVITE